MGQNRLESIEGANAIGDEADVKNLKVEDREQDSNVWTRTPSRCLVPSIKDKQTCFGFQKLDCRNGPSCRFSHFCVGCGGASPFNQCDCTRTSQIQCEYALLLCVQSALTSLHLTWNVCVGASLALISLSDFV